MQDASRMIDRTEAMEDFFPPSPSCVPEIQSECTGKEGELSRSILLEYMSVRLD
jgi:hypothetical protein